MINLKLMFK